MTVRMEPAFRFFAQAVVDKPPAGARMLGSAFSASVAALHVAAQKAYLAHATSFLARRKTVTHAAPRWPWALVCDSGVEGVSSLELPAFKAAVVESLRVHLGITQVCARAAGAAARTACAADVPRK